MIRDIIKSEFRPGVAERPIALVCKTSGFPFVGSNPTPWTKPLSLPLNHKTQDNQLVNR